MACLCILISMICQNSVLVFADVKTTAVTVNFTESPYQIRSNITEVKDIFGISDISVNTGKVEYSISGDKVTIKVSEGVPSRIGPHTKSVTVTEENTYDDFPESFTYSLEGYSGILPKVDSGYDSSRDLFWAKYSGNVTNPETKFYKYTVNYTYTLNVAPQVTLTSPINGDAIKDKINVLGFVKDENVGDILNVYYAFDTYTESTIGTAYKSSVTADGTEQGIDGTIDITPFSLIDGNHKIYIWAVDKRGVRSVPVETSFIVDTVAPAAPTLSQDPTIPTNKSVDVNVSYPADAAVKEVRINGGSWVPFDTAAKYGKIVMDDNGTVEARATDLAGNVSEIGKLDVTNIDKVAPAKPVISQQPDNSTPTNGDVEITITYPADAAEKLYKVGTAGTWTKYDTAFKIPANDTVYAVCKDAAGNTSEVASIDVMNIDKVHPVAPTLVADITTPTNKDVNVTVSYPADAAVKEVRINGGSWVPFDTAVKGGRIVMDANGTVEARAIDSAGNVSEIGKLDVNNIDKVSPVMPVISQEPVNTIFTNGDDTITVTYPADAVEKLYKIGTSGTWTEYKDTFKLTENNTIYAVCKDAAGNTSEEASIVVTNIDKIPPVAPTLVADITTSTNKSVSVDVYYPADAAEKEIRIDGGKWVDFDDVAKDGKVIMDENGTVEARAIDAAGNISDIGRLVISNIDKTSPDTPVLTPDTTEPTNKSVTVSVYYPGDSVTKEIKIGDGDWVPYKDPVEVDKNTTIEARSADDAGNYSPIGKYEVSNIDTTPPMAPVITTSDDETIAKPITATITRGKDEESGVDRTEYCLEGATTSDWQKYVEGTNIPIKNIGSTKISARTIDKAGNISPVATKTVVIKEEIKNNDDHNNNNGGMPVNNDTNSNNNGGNVTEDDTTVPAVTAVDLAVFLSSDKSKYAEGDTITFTIEYKNKSSVAVNDVIVKAEIPAYTTVVDLAGGTANGTAIEWKIAKLAANTSGKIEYKVSVNKLDKAEISSSNTATVKSANVTKTEDDSSKTIFLLYSGIDNYHPKYIAGYLDNTFRPGNNVTRAEVAAMMYRVLGIDKMESTTKNYTDLKNTHWAYKSIVAVTNAGLFAGYIDGSFHPDSYITRAEFATVLANYLGLKNVEHDKMNFSDINNHWAKNFIEEIYRVKLIEGYIENGERLFKPDNNISRSEAVTIVNKMLFRGPLSGIEMPFKDVAETHWAYGQILESALDHNFTRNDDDSETAVIK